MMKDGAKSTDSSNESFKLAGTAPRVLLLSSSSIYGIHKLCSALHDEISNQPDLLDIVCHRSYLSRLEISDNPDYFY